MQGAEQSRILAAIRKEYPWMYLVFTIAPSGANVARSDDQPLINYAERNYFKDVIGKNRNLAWETLISKTSKKPALILAVPIRVENAIVGVLAAGVNIEDLSRIVANWRNGTTGFAFLVDENGKVIAHPSDELVLAQRGMQDHPLVAQHADGKPHLATFTDNGAESLGYIQGLRFHWAVAAQQSSAELLAPQRQTLLIGLLLLGSAAVLVVLIAMAASKLLVHPIVDMTHAAEHMSIGELDKPINSTSKDELGMLARALERLRKSMLAAIARM
jgi:methyl-accepting chemotaxis protein